MNFNFETIGTTNLVVRTRVHTDFHRKNLPYFLRFMAKNDVKDFDWSKHLTSFSTMKHTKDDIFFR